MKHLHYFNPTAELAVANGCLSYQPPLALQRFEYDLACIPMLYSGCDATIAVQYGVPQHLIDMWQYVGLETPSFAPMSTLPQLCKEQKFRLQPWANSPNLRRIFPAYNENERKGLQQLEIPEWHPELNLLSRRDTALPIWKELVAYGLAIDEDIPVFCNTMGELESAVAAKERSVIKLNHTSSGRGLFFVNGKISPVDKARITKQISHGCIVENQREKIADFSIHFAPKENKVAFLGWTEMHNGVNGRYHGNAVSNSETIRLETENININEMLEPILKFYSERLRTSPYMQIQNGPVGIDMLLYRGSDGNIMLHPCVEINARHTMGYVSLSLKKLLHQNAHGTFTIQHFPQGAERSVAEITANSPIQMEDGKIRRGCAPLSDYTHGAEFVALLNVE